jgi:hypothetical protein
MKSPTQEHTVQRMNDYRVNTNAKKFHEGQGAAEERHGKRNLG